MDYLDDYIEAREACDKLRERVAILSNGNIELLKARDAALAERETWQTKFRHACDMNAELRARIRGKTVSYDPATEELHARLAEAKAARDDFDQKGDELFDSWQSCLKQLSVEQKRTQTLVEALERWFAATARNRKNDKPESYEKFAFECESAMHALEQLVAAHRAREGEE